MFFRNRSRLNRLSRFGLNGLPVWIASLVFCFGGVTAHADNEPQPEKAQPETAQSETPDSVKPAPVSFHSDVLPILRAQCFGCHQGAKQLGEYQMTDFDAMLRGGETGQAAIVPGDSKSSYLIDQISLHDGVAEMPKAPSKPLNEIEIELIRRWIDEGAVNDSPAASGPRFTKENPPTYVGPPTIASIDASPDDGVLAVAGYHEVLLLDAKTGERKNRLVGLSSRINSVRFSPDGRLIAVAGGSPGESGELQIWKADSGELQLSVPVTFDTITGVSWSPDNKRIAFGCNDNTVRAIDVETGQQVLYQGAHEDWVRDTGFTNDGKHVVSVARDMTCKLTEVESERFIDNVTSITPGALSGGLTSIAIHPARDEAVVGGADGIVKVYRIFRQTKRQIGDDANLIRRLPELPGRIRQVVVNPVGTHIAAAATIDGHSEVRVWKSGFSGELSPELKAMLSKRVASRSAEETKKIEASRNETIEQTIKFELPGVAVYAIELADSGAVWVAGNDGNIRHLDPDGKTIATFPVIEFGAAAEQPDTHYDADESTRRVNAELAAAPSSDDPAVPTAGAIVDLKISPEEIRLNSPYEYVQLVAVAKLADGSSIDVTGQITIQADEAFAIQTDGLLRPRKDAEGVLVATLAGRKQSIPYQLTGQSDFDVDFIRDVNPVLSRSGCNQGTCHGAQKGKNGFRLSLRGYDPIFDIRALTDDLAARRINPSAPENSMMLRKPLGLTPHEGGVLMTQGDPYHAVLRQWIAAGSKLDLQTPRVASITVFPHNPVVESTTARQQVRVVATYADGTTRDVTRESFIDSGNTEVATVQPGGILRAVRRGEAPVLARFEGAYAATTLTVMGDRSDYVDKPTETWNRIDELVAKKWQRMKIVPSGLADDATFLRRVHLDLTGLPPSSEAVRAFLADPTPTQQKRADIIDRLIGNEDFIVYWTNKWADLLQVNRKFLAVEGSQKYREWIRAAVAENRPYDQFAREILTASGSNNETPPASYYKVLRTPEDTMENTTHLFLGIRFNCNKCHDHPFERWTQDQYYEMAAFFAHVARKSDPASGNRKVGGSAVEQATPLYEIIDDTNAAEVKHERTGQPVTPKFPYELERETDVAGNDSAKAETLVSTKAADESKPAEEAKPAGENKPADPPTRREQLAEWMTHPDNPYFARSYVNRIWAYMTGVGLIEPIDDIRAGNPATNPELLDYLTNEFVRSGFDSRHLMRLICNSRTYGLSVETHPLNEDDFQNYSHATARRLPAEVIYDAVHQLTGSISNLPGMPAGTRAAAATDAGVTLADGFLENLGRPVRETACECERSDDLQLGPVMALISGPTIGAAISDPKNVLEKIVADHPTDEALVEELFLRALGRFPSDKEYAAFAQIKNQIQGDHGMLTKRLEESEAEWKIRLPQLEAARTDSLAKIKQQIQQREAEIADERAKLASERDERIKKATENLENEKKRIPEKIEALAATAAKESIEWFPLMPKKVDGQGNAKLRILPDRSVLASDGKAKATYLVDFETGLQNVTGFRVEALTDESLDRGGPGLAANFVVTELIVRAGPVSDPKKFDALKIKSGKADFLQSGFAINPTFDGNTGNQNAWAVSPAIGVPHWATFQFAEPIQVDGKMRLRFEISQNHNAEKHLLGRFRISLTTHAGDIPLSQTEDLEVAATTQAEQRTEQQTDLLNRYLLATDGKIAEMQNALAVAQKPVPPDEKIVELQKRQKRFEVETPTDPALVQLRANLKQSESQLTRQRLTAAEDLTWALVNTPAFLFNH